MTDRERDDVVRDPVTGIPLHEFIVGAVQATPGGVTPTEGDPIEEPGVQQGPHGHPRRPPVILFNIDPLVEVDADVATQIGKAVKDARRRQLGSGSSDSDTE